MYVMALRMAGGFRSANEKGLNVDSFAGLILFPVAGREIESVSCPASRHAGMMMHYVVQYYYILPGWLAVHSTLHTSLL